MCPSTPPPTGAPSPAGADRFAQRAWQAFCRGVVRLFFRRCEVIGRERLPADEPVVLCANHADALVDAVLVQAVLPRSVQPLARSGLFANPLLRPLLAAQQAVPVYRRQDAEAGAAEHAARNDETFARCIELLGAGRVLLIFPEGQSHSDPHLRPLKTGAARLALGARQATGRTPCLLPIGLTFTRKGRFRSSVLVQIGEPVSLPTGGPDDQQAVRELTAALERGLAAVTLNVGSREELELLRLLQRFFAFRRGRRAYRRSLHRRFRALQHLIASHARWVAEAPAEAHQLARELRRFERLCRRFGVDDYQLTVRYTPWVVTKFLLQTAFFGAVVFPLFAWAVLNSALPYLATRHTALALARGKDQFDTAKILLGIGFFALFWSAQTLAVWWSGGLLPAAIYAASLPAAGAVALAVARERTKIIENTRMFLVFTRRARLRELLVARRRDLEVRLARFARRAKRAAARRAQEPRQAVELPTID